MNRHIMTDKMLLWVAAKWGTPFFRESVESSTFEEHVAGIRFELPAFGREGIFPLALQTLAGRWPAAFKVSHWAGPQHPTLIYHQGGAEQPFDRTVRKLYPPSRRPDINVIVVQTPCQGSVSDINRNFAHLNIYLMMVASAVEITEQLINAPELAKSPMVCVSGYSLGGFVTGRHHMHYNSADAYVPFMAGTRHGDIFFSSINAGKIAQENRDYVLSRLNFDHAWSQRDHPNVFPVVGRYDQLNWLSIQLPSYGSTPVEVWEGGHLYGVRRPKRMRTKIERHMLLGD